MKCDKILKDAFEGIEFRYKLDGTLENLGNQKLTAKQLEGFLLGKGISPKEIKQSGILIGMENDNRALSGSEWLSKSGSQRLTTFNVAPEKLGYDTYTLGRKGADNVTYNEALTTIVKPKNNVPGLTHFSNEISTPKESLLGWRRTHIDEINGKKTLVLNEIQSDWAQTERAGRGTFESNTKPKITYKEATSEYYKEKDKFFETNDNEDAWIEYINTNPRLLELDKIINGLESSNTTVTDFPMTELKHNQFQIVGAIDEALKQGIDTVAIPIQRENELAGSAGVTKFYENLNTKVLPDIRKKLEKQGLSIKVDKKIYKSGSNKDLNIDKVLDDLPIFARDNNVDSIDTINSKIIDYEQENGLIKSIDGLNKFAEEFRYEDLLEDYKNSVFNTNDLWTLTIEEVPNGKVKWDVYSILATLGLSTVASKSEANAQMQDNPDIYQLSKRVGSKLNYNESNKEILDYITSIESGGDYKAKNKESSAFGKYQILRGTMVEKAKELGLTLHEAKKPYGQEKIMNSLLSDYKERLKQFYLPITKENLFVLHNLGQTRGVRILRGTYSDNDIHAMRVNLSTEERKLPRSVIPQAYAERYNINVPSKQED